MKYKGHYRLQKLKETRREASKLYHEDPIGCSSLIAVFLRSRDRDFESEKTRKELNIKSDNSLFPPYQYLDCSSELPSTWLLRLLHKVKHELEEKQLDSNTAMMLLTNVVLIRKELLKRPDVSSKDISDLEYIFQFVANKLPLHWIDRVVEINSV